MDAETDPNLVELLARRLLPHIAEGSVIDRDEHARAIARTLCHIYTRDVERSLRWLSVTN